MSDLVLERQSIARVIDRDIEHYTAEAAKLRAELALCPVNKRAFVRRKFTATMIVTDRLCVLRWHLDGEA
jgi:hypothetical protein